MLSSRNITGLVSESSTNTVKVLGGQVSQVRYRRTLAYPFYSKAGNIPQPRKGRKQTVFKRLMDGFLGPKNFKGQYYLNKYSYPNQNHTTNYIDPRGEQGNALLGTRSESEDDQFGSVLDKEGEQTDKPKKEEKRQGEEEEEGDSRQRNALQPFPFNSHFFTNVQISQQTKKDIVNDVITLGLPSQQVALKYGLKIQRIEAIVKLEQIEQQWEKDNLVNDDLEEMSKVVYKMFPIYKPSTHGENLTEIPIPQKTLHSRFLTIAESEPFGPIDAAQQFELEPAAQTLQRLSEGGEHSSHSAAASSKSNKPESSFIAPMKEGDKTAFRFTYATVGQVGYRYGKTYRDNRKNRKIGFDASGKMVYLLD